MYPQREMILDTFNYFVSSDFCRYLRYSVDCMFRYLETTNVVEVDTSNTTVMFLSVSHCLPQLPASPTSITTKPHTTLLTHSSQRREARMSEFSWDPGNIQIRTRSLQHNLEPLVVSVTQLIDQV